MLQRFFWGILCAGFLLQGCVSTPKTSQNLTPSVATKTVKSKARRKLASYGYAEYGKECSEELGVELPPVDCTKGELLKIEENGVEVTDRIPDHCDKPSLADTRFACVPGGRILKIETKNAKGETVVTMVACRRSALHPIDSPIFENIAMFQHNTESNKVCWFQIRRPDGGMDTRDIAPPYTADPQRAKKFSHVDPNKLYAPFESVVNKDDQCISCHDGQLYIRTPWVRQTKRGFGPPDNTDHGRLTHVGEPFAKWNLDSYQPKRIRVNADVYDAKFPKDTKETGVASADACTVCHSVGKSPIQFEQGTCRGMMKDFFTGPGTGYVTTEKLSTRGKTFPVSHWMPPIEDREDFGGGEEGLKKWKKYYSRAIAAVKFCCDNPDAEYNGQRICTEKPEVLNPGDKGKPHEEKPPTPTHSGTNKPRLK